MSRGGVGIKISHFCPSDVGVKCHKCQSSLEWCAEWVTVPWGWASRQDSDFPHRPEVSVDAAWSLLQFDHLSITVRKGWIRNRVSGNWKRTGSQRFEQKLCFCVHIWIFWMSPRDVCGYPELSLPSSELLFSFDSFVVFPHPLLHTECPVFKMLGAGIALDWGFYFEIFEYLWDIFRIGSKSKHEFHLYLSPEGHLHTIYGPSAPLLQSVSWRQGQIFHFWHLVGTWEVVDFGPSQILQFWIRNDQPSYYIQQMQKLCLRYVQSVL